MRQKYDSFGLSPQERMRFDQISSVLAREMANGEELGLPLVTMNRVSDCRCEATGEKIPVGEECVLLLSASTKRRVGVFRSKDVFRSLLEAGSLWTLRGIWEDAKRAARRKRPPKPAKPVPPHMNSCFCIQCGKPIKRPDEMPFLEFGKVRRCDSCRSTGRMLPGVVRYCRTCGVPFTPEPTSGQERVKSTCPKHNFHV